MNRLRTSDFDYDLPESAIAQHPSERGQSRLLVLDELDEARHRLIADLPSLLQRGDLLVANDTRVIPARLFGHRLPGGGRVELLLVEKLESTRWEALARPARRLSVGVRIELESGLEGEVVAVGGDGRRQIQFADEVEPSLESDGHVPLPPYIHRADEDTDRQRYQTMFARHDGAIAAPTAGLHFTPELIAALRQRGVEQTSVTLHVGIGTFKPVKVDEVEAHRMDEERYIISDEAAEAIARTRDAGGRIVAVGTTVVRALESVAAVDGEITPGLGRTELFITPGYRFRIVDVLLTNFHLPRSTLLMLVSALAGDGDRGRQKVLNAYREAIARGYRFYSYGDAMMIERQRRA